MPEEIQNLTDEGLYKRMCDLREGLKAQPMDPGRVRESPLGQEVRRRAKQDLYFFSKYFVGYTQEQNAFMTEDVHRRVCDLFVKKDPSKEIGEQDHRKERLLLYPRGSFKALDLDTKIPTPHGFVLMRDIAVGDVVFDETGRTTAVVEVGPVFENRPCYEVEFSTGEKIVADAGHLWETDARRDRDAKRNGRLKQKYVPCPSVKTTEDLAQSVFCRKEHNHRIRVANALIIEKKRYSIAPYVLGCWLGDGTSSTGQITIADQEIANEIAKEGEIIRPTATKYRWVFNGGSAHEDYRKHSGKSFSSRLRKLGLISNKHIPLAYLRGSYEQRLALLQGLMDTDGSCSKTGVCSFSNTNALLVEQVKQLLASLGFKPSNIGCYDAVLNSTVVGKFYVVLFKAYNDTVIFRLPRKQKRLRPQGRITLQKYRHIVAVRAVESRPVRCIAVAAKRHLYLVGESCIPTHNSTIDVHDGAQWILNFPDIRILFLTAAKDLAVGFVDDLKSVFVVKLEKPSFMNIFFPEFCVTEEALQKMNMYEFTTPERKIDRREPTATASSIESTLSGFHFDVIKADDMVSNSNSDTEEQCKKVSKNFYINRKMLMPFGYLDYIGTRYHDVDHYGDVLEKNVGEFKTEKGPCWELIENTTTGFRVLIGRAWQPKPGFEGKPFMELKENEVFLLFPQYLSYSFLRQEYSKDEISAESQYQQNPRQKMLVTFDRALLIGHTVPFTKVPYNGPISITWDFAFSKKKGRDYSTGCVAIHDEKGRIFIVDLIRGRFQPTELAKAVVDLVLKWKYPFVVGIEDAVGSRFLEPAILLEAKKTGDQNVIAVCSKIDWFAPEQQKDAKKTRMASLHPWFSNDRLFLVDVLPYLEVTYKEFEMCLASHHHDDIPDVISQQPRYAPRLQMLMDKNEIQTWSRDEAQWNITFEEGADQFGRIGMGGFEVPLNPMVLPEENISTQVPAPGMDPILGAGLSG